MRLSWEDKDESIFISKTSSLIPQTTNFSPSLGTKVSSKIVLASI